MLKMKTTAKKQSFNNPDTHGSYTPCELKPFPIEGKVRVKTAAPYLGIGVSTFWLFVKQGRIQPPMKFGQRVSVWNASYIRDLAENGIPEASADDVA